MSKKYVISDGVIICWDDVSKADNMGLSPHDIRKKYGITLEDYTKQREDKARKEERERVRKFLYKHSDVYLSNELYCLYRDKYLKDSKEDKVSKSPVTFTSDESFTPHPLGNPDLHSTKDN